MLLGDVLKDERGQRNNQQGVTYYSQAEARCKKKKEGRENDYPKHMVFPFSKTKWKSPAGGKGGGRRFPVVGRAAAYICLAKQHRSLCPLGTLQ